MGACVMALGLVACGGGGGDAGTQVLGNGSGSGSGTGSGSGSGSGSGGASGSTPVYAITLDVQRNGASITNNQITSSETVQAVATVTRDGQPLQGVVVSFSEQGGSLLKIAPTSATALTDTSGKASVDVSAAAVSGLGATTLKADMSSGTATASTTYALGIQAGASTGAPPPVPAAITFVGSNPSDLAIVIKGAGGTGRSESAILTFRVVDASNTPISGTRVDFAMNTTSSNGTNDATLTTTSGLTDANGAVTATVSSGTQPASIVVTATSAVNAGVSAQSDTLIVSNGVPVDGGFEIAAETYNLDGRKTGDKTKVTAFVRDRFGNPVPDGVAVGFTTDYGVVASSTLGGCTTANGQCTVDFLVQNPRGDGIATVVGEVRVGGSTLLSQNLMINLAGIGQGGVATSYMTLGGNVLDFGGTCKKTFDLLLSDGSGKAPAAGTTVSVASTSSNVTASVKAGSPVLDQLDGNFSPVLITIEVDLTSTLLVPRCVVGGVNSISSNTIRLNYKIGSNVYPQTFNLQYGQ
jgi:hypothetical protein